MSKTLAPVQPGEVLAEDFMAPAGLTTNQLALSLRIPANRITAIIAGKRGITPARRDAATGEPGRPTRSPRVPGVRGCPRK